MIEFYTMADVKAGLPTTAVLLLAMIPQPKHFLLLGFPDIYILRFPYRKMRDPRNSIGKSSQSHTDYQIPIDIISTLYNQRIL
jgi:hypothetical protein